MASFYDTWIKRFADNPGMGKGYTYNSAFGNLGRFAVEIFNIKTSDFETHFCSINCALAFLLSKNCDYDFKPDNVVVRVASKNSPYPKRNHAVYLDDKISNTPWGEYIIYFQLNPAGQLELVRL